jgi:hypothetical protein
VRCTHLELHEFVIDISIGMNIGQDLECLDEVRQPDQSQHLHS